MRYLKVGVAALAVVLPAALVRVSMPTPALSQSSSLPPGAFADNVEVVGFTDLNGHIPFKMAIHEVNQRWYMYAGAQGDRGWSVLDITDPAQTKVLNWIPGPKNTRTVQVDLADGELITALEKSQRGGDTDPGAPFEEGILI